MDALARVFWVGLGGFLGANARYWLGEWINSRVGESFPWATFAINVSGSFVLGLLLVVITERFTVPGSPALRLFLAVGFLGAYTTFSTFEYETLALVSTGGWVRALLNAFGSLAAGFAAVWLGVRLGRLL